MKTYFLPLFQRAYDCDDTVAEHICSNCDDQVEHARIRRGAWVHHDAYLLLVVDPTDQAVWEAQITAGKVIILPELRGSFDGGTPKKGPGYGDLKEKYLGSDFSASVLDPVYAANYAHYASLVGKQNWHFVYLTENYGHMTDVPVTVAPKNPITENTDDEVVWSSDVTWFQYMTPAPFLAPLEVFQCAAA